MVTLTASRILIDCECLFQDSFAYRFNGKSGQRISLPPSLPCDLRELSSGIDRSGNAGVGAVVLELRLADKHGIETFNNAFLVAPSVPILIAMGPDAEATTRQPASSARICQSQL